MISSERCETTDERIKELRDEIDCYGTGSLHAANTLVAICDELLQRRQAPPAAAGVTEEREALDIALRHMRTESERYVSQKLYKSAAQYDRWIATLRALAARLWKEGTATVQRLEFTVGEGA